jgi:hypothetical protein
MASKNKTTETSVSVDDFINSFVSTDTKKKDSYRLIELMQKWSGCEPKMWGPSIIGFGTYHYKYASGREGDAPLIAFSPRKAAFSLYVGTPGEENKKLLDTLGKFTMGKYCIYFKQLDDLNLEILERISKATIKYTKQHLDCACRL